MLPIHPIADAFPQLAGDAFEHFAQDIATNGLREPIWLWNGKIIDGRQRYRACLAKRVEPRFRDWDGNGSLADFVVSLNVHRRHLSASQLAMVAATLIPFYQEESQARMKAGRRDPSANWRQGKAAALAAASTGASTRSVERAQKVRQQAPALVPEVVQGRATVARAAKFVELPPREQLRRIKEEGRSLREKAAQEQRAERIAQGTRLLDRAAKVFGGLGTEAVELLAAIWLARAAAEKL